MKLVLFGHKDITKKSQYRCLLVTEKSHPNLKGHWLWVGPGVRGGLRVTEVHRRTMGQELFQTEAHILGQFSKQGNPKTSGRQTRCPCSRKDRDLSCPSGWVALGQHGVQLDPGVPR